VAEQLFRITEKMPVYTGPMAIKRSFWGRTLVCPCKPRSCHIQCPSINYFSLNNWNMIQWVTF